jgi:conjugative relaxase-like TrwC/TraI family protein
MLSMGAMKSGQVSYYQGLAQEDYYLAGGEPPGVWLGGGADLLSIGRETDSLVDGAELAAHFLGFSKQGGKLVQNAGKPSRQPGWDLTFSAPKSVSVLWSQLEPPLQQEIQAAQAAAVKAAIQYIESFAESRAGKGGTERVRVDLVVAAFEHSCSRALDPQLHTHCLVMNLGVHRRGTVRALVSKPLYQQKMVIGAYYRAELARQLQARLGVELERPLNRRGEPASWFEIKGIPPALLKHFSKRRAAIEAELGSRGLESASAAAFAALSTREAKSLVPPRAELHAGWKREGLELGFQPAAVLTRPLGRTAAAEQELYRQALAGAIAEITFSENVFTKAELLRRTLEAAQVWGLSAEKVADNVLCDLESDPQFVSLGAHQGETLWTTAEILKLEQEFLEAAQQVLERRFRPVSEAIVAATVAAPRGSGAGRFTLDAEQQAAVRYITQGGESLKVVTGFAGTGKTDMLAAAREALERGGYRVIGTALASVAARTLQEQAGIPSRNIREREFQLYPSLEQRLKHLGRQLVRAAWKQPTYQLPQLTLDENTVLVIDEAGMVGTRDFALLAQAVRRQGGSIVAVGDEQQLASIERGGCLEKLAKTVNGVRLTEIRRQRDQADREAVKDVVEGRPEEALKHYAAKGQFYVGSRRADAERQLIDDWATRGGAARPQAHRIFAGTRAEVERFNEQAQWQRVRQGLVDPAQRVEHGGTTFMVGDRVRFNEAAKTRGIQKGEGGVVVACHAGFTGKYVAVALEADDSSLAERSWEALKHHAQQLVKAALGKRTERLPPRRDLVLIPLESLNPLAKTYRGLSLDYAMTTHLGQGQTVDHAYVLLGGTMTDRELSYVQSSRHRDKLFLYADQRQAGQSLTALARELRPLAEPALDEPIPDYSTLVMQMKTSRAKRLAFDMQPVPAPTEPRVELAP